MLRTVLLTLAAGVLGTVLRADPLAAQCSGCTSSHSCSVSTTRSLCSWDCNPTTGICACGDARCPPIIRPSTMLVPGPEAVLLTVATFVVTGCDGSQEVLAPVVTPFGVGMLGLAWLPWGRIEAVTTAPAARAESGGWPHRTIAPAIAFGAAGRGAAIGTD